MKRYKKPRTVWLGRVATGGYEIGRNKTHWTKDKGFMTRGFLAFFCPSNFEHVTGIRLERNELVKVRIVVEEEQ